MIWPFRRKSRAEPVVRAEAVPPAPPGDGWRRWFELSHRAAFDPPSNHEWVQIWRDSWDHPRVTRSVDIPYEMNGPGFWWRPWDQPAVTTTLLIDNDEPAPRLTGPGSSTPPTAKDG